MLREYKRIQSSRERGPVMMRNGWIEMMLEVIQVIEGYHSKYPAAKEACLSAIGPR